ncbi:MAG: hypothetical protein H5T74_12720 [Actinobacteria bacterium]|nr:hypothetical protein [Actinomycetota bacterium]
MMLSGSHRTARSLPAVLVATGLPPLLFAARIPVAAGGSGAAREAAARGSSASRMEAAADSASPPSRTVKLAFIRHSCGENWLIGDGGGLGRALRDNNYFVSDTNYGWGPDRIGSSTDIGHWWTWFREPSSPAYTAALFAESGLNTPYSRLADDYEGENEIVMFKYVLTSNGGGPYVGDLGRETGNRHRWRDGATAQLTYLYADGTAPFTGDYRLAGRSRTTLDVNEEAGADREAAAKMESDRQVLAERPMYLANGQDVGGGHDVVGFSP